MKAFVFERTGDPNEVLALRELPEPKPGPGEILVRVRLSPVHPSDMHIMRGRFLDGLASGALRLPPAKRHRPQNIADALRDADGAPREGKPLLDLSSWTAE